MSVTSRPRLSPRARKTLLTTHVATAVSWLGADLVLIVLGVAALRGQTGAYAAAATIGDWLLVPLTLAVWAIGVLNAVLTPWGLVRHRWVLVKLVITTVMVLLVCFALTPGLREAAALGDELARPERINMVVAPSVSGALLILATALSTFKPWGRTRRSA